MHPIADSTEHSARYAEHITSHQNVTQPDGAPAAAAEPAAGLGLAAVLLLAAGFAAGAAAPLRSAAQPLSGNLHRV